jgi:hypothetical protein
LQFETFEVSQTTQNAIDPATIAIESEFYQLINVSQEDIDLRKDLIVQLQQEQRTLLDLLEAPSNVIIGTGNQQPDIGSR